MGYLGARPTYGILYGMKTTIYVPDDVKEALGRRALIEQRSQADIIREALSQAVAAYMFPEPTLPLGRRLRLPPDLSERVDEFMDGFGGQ